MPTETFPTIEIISKDIESVTLRKTVPGPYKLLLFTDLHLDGRADTSARTLARMTDAILREKPDLVLLGGDNVTGGNNEARSHELARLFEDLGVYWGGVLGNHEGDNPDSITRRHMMEVFTSYSHCIMRQGPAEIDGDCNYYIRLLRADGTTEQIIFCLDTFDEISSKQRATLAILPGKKYDGAHPNQVAWYQQKAAALQSESPAAKSLLLLHIPLPAYDKALAAGPLQYGDCKEDICSTAYENGLFEAIRESGSTQAVFCGHDHINNCGVRYQGILLSYIEMSGYSSYGMKNSGAPESAWLQGYTVLTFDGDGICKPEQKLYASIYND
ncbi:MAG: metallophosphoesterase [Firmicutes bacterium]|nr:metallophosphoesterase [Bacillota bacterium]